MMFKLIALLTFVVSLPSNPMVTQSIDPAKAARGLRLIETSDDAPAVWMTDEQINDLYKHNTKFMDLTFTGTSPPSNNFDAAPTIPSEPTQQQLVSSINANANTSLMKSALKTFSDFNNRYYRSDTGVVSANWLFDQVKSITSASAKGQSIKTSQFDHPWGQKSIIARIEGQDGNQETVIVGAHQDSINQSNPMSGRAPGADDDGSGTVTVLETYRLILESGFKPKRPLEFHWYSGEEAGLLGSQGISRAYANDKRQVAGMLQFDMTAFPTKSRPDIGILTDRVNSVLTALLRKIVKAYTTLPMADFQCGYGCSDHASWTRAGYPSALAFESSNMRENHNIHSPADSYDTVDFDHALNFVKIAVGFVVEMAH